MKIAQFIVSAGYDIAKPDAGVQAWEQRAPFDTTTVASPIASLEHPGLEGNGAVVRIHEDGFYVVNTIIWLRLDHIGGAS